MPVCLHWVSLYLFVAVKLLHSAYEKSTDEKNHPDGSWFAY